MSTISWPECVLAKLAQCCESFSQGWKRDSKRQRESEGHRERERNKQHQCEWPKRVSPRFVLVSGQKDRQTDSRSCLLGVSATCRQTKENERGKERQQEQGRQSKRQMPTIGAYQTDASHVCELCVCAICECVCALCVCIHSTIFLKWHQWNMLLALLPCNNIR